MKRPVILWLLMVWTVFIFGSEVEVETINYSKLQERNGIYYKNGAEKPFNGKAVRYYKTGKKELETNFKDGKKQGKAIRWYDNGQKRSEINYIDGKAQGKEISWPSEMEKMHKADTDLESKLVKLDNDVERMFLGVYSGNVNIVKEQLYKNVFVEARDKNGSTALHISQNKEIIELLILKGADVNCLDKSLMTPIFNKEVSLTKILVEAGADIHAKSYKGNTPLMWYSYSGYLEGIKYMFSLGADINLKNVDGQTAYDIAEHFASKEVLDYLISIGAKPGKEIK